MEKGKIFIGGLSWDTDRDALQSYFSQYGEVTDCVVMNNPQTGKSRGFGFVTFRDPAAVDVILATPKHTIDGRNVDAKACSARGAGGGGGGERQSGGRGSGGGGGGYSGRTTKIFIGGLPNDANDDNLKGCFSRFGQVVDVVIMYDQEKNRPRGFGFLTFDSEDAVEAAVKEHYVDFNGKKIECKRAEPRQGGGGGRGGKSMHGGGGGGYNGFNADQNWGGMGDGTNWNQYGYGQQQGGGGGAGGYGQPGFDQNWGQPNYGQNYGQGWGQQGGYGQGYGPGYGPQPPQPPPQQNWGGQPPSGQGQGYGGYSGPGFNNLNGNQGQGQGYGGYSGPGFSGGGGGGGQGYGAAGNYSGSQDGYGGGYQQNQSQGGKSSSGGGGSSGGYHPYKR